MEALFRPCGLFLYPFFIEMLKVLQSVLAALRVGGHDLKSTLEVSPNFHSNVLDLGTCYFVEGEGYSFNQDVHMLEECTRRDCGGVLRCGPYLQSLNAVQAILLFLGSQPAESDGGCRWRAVLGVTGESRGAKNRVMI